MKIIALSDIHGNLIPLNPCDVVCIAGDIVPLQIQRNLVKSLDWTRQKFIPWCESLDCQRIILIAGNHDFMFELLKEQDISIIFKNHPKIIYLKDSLYTYNNVKFYGTPWVTGLPGWVFNKDDDESIMNNIPDCDVLISHAPPYSDTGTVFQKNHNYLRNFGSTNLLNRINKGGIKYVVCGHIHSGKHHGEIIKDTTCYNVSILDENYEEAYWPQEFEI